jgi:hypothetical protein
MAWPLQGRIVPIVASEYNLVASHDQDRSRMMTLAGSRLLADRFSLLLVCFSVTFFP